MSKLSQKSIACEQLAHGQNLQSIRAHFEFQGPPWLKALQNEAWQTFCQHGFPSRREELWKYTDLTFLEKRSFVSAPRFERTQLPQALLSNAHHLVFINGHFHEELSDLPLAVTILPLSRALQECPEQIKPYITEAAAWSTLPSPASLNLAFAQQGIYIHLPAQTILEKPIHLVFVSTPWNEETTLYQPHNHIVFDRQSEGVIIEEHVGTAQANYYKNTLTRIHLQTGSQLSHYKIQREAKNAIHTAATQIIQQRDSQFRHYQISLGSRLARDDMQVTLADNATCQLRGLYLLAENQHTDHHTRIDHYGISASSEEIYKGVLTDKAKGVFNGKIIVHPGAQKTRSLQTNKNLLLTKTAEMNTKPELEIYADDVQCRHGATVGQLDQEALFYLRSRGISLDAAATLLTQAFVEELLTPITIPQVATYIRHFVTQKLVSFTLSAYEHTSDHG